jgi:hypothetical protein
MREMKDMTTDADQARTFVADLLAANAKAAAEAPKLPRPSTRQRRAEQAMADLTGEDAARAAEAELSREPYRKVECDKPDCPVCRP